MSDIHMDPKVVSALRDVMEGGFEDLLDTFLSDSEERLDQLRSTHEAHDLSLVAHSFKGSSSNMGAIRLAHLCGLLEERAQKKPLAGIKELVVKIDDEYQMVRRLYRAERQRFNPSNFASG
ncbi:MULTISPECIES: Hpt domain-containing protein [Pseudomonas]|uniref:Hpt domain-containing protein n=1 Tax=Pseudomonas TaxID=286 RepID=UPI00028958B6|nr:MULTISPECIES: Hpt domain-containing protein [Pseudomonas]AMB80346.1 histidine kinase [Pseudomonas fragi]MCB1654337.1 Hpt domain-containing protein [Pseudomonadales bacterium]MCH4869383.1 Hpt domain-containing protein [Pseudomonas sp. TMW22089]NBF15366.1 Hpt domain-containing protein [Pseudomonas sp. Fl4BN2]NNG61056.1 Hpt domain-containing protein [Pseudomonas sp. GC01]